MNRIEIRDYYRKCAGLLGLMNAAFVFVASCLAIYIADFYEPYAEEGNSLVALNGLYAVFVIGLVFAVIALIAGIISVKGHGEGIFHFQRFVSVVLTALMLISTVISVYISRDKIEWTTENMTMTMIYIGVSLLSTIFSVVIFLYAMTGSKYYDKNKSFAKEVPEDMEANRPAIVHQGISGICASILGISVALLSLYFSNMIQYYDETMVENNGGYSGFFHTMFILGMVVTAVYLVMSVLIFKVKNSQVYKINVGITLLNLVYIVVLACSFIVAMMQDFVKSQCPDVAYIIFAFVLIVIEVTYIVTGLIPFAKKCR